MTRLLLVGLGALLAGVVAGWLLHALDVERRRI